MTTTQFGLPETVIFNLQTLFQNYPEIEKVILFGSRAMDTYRTGSDIDLCIVSQTLSLSQLLAIENQIDDLLIPWKVDLLLKSTIDNPALLEHIDKKGVTFYPSSPHKF